MKAVLQRCLQASVSVDNEIVGSITNGLVILLGVDKDDTQEDLDYLIKKITQLRIFNDDNGKMNLNITQVNGQILSISQFTLLSNTKKGNRPSFTQAALPDMAKKMYEIFNTTLQNNGISVETGIFGADMKVSLINDGPVTIVLDTKNL